MTGEQVKEQHFENKGGYWIDEAYRPKKNEDTIDPPNLTVTWGRSASFYEILIHPNGKGTVALVSKHQVAYGEQMEEYDYAEGLLHAHAVAVKNPHNQVVYVRSDSLSMPEDAHNAPFKFINGEWRKK